jgi:hypothetical protein
MAPEAQHPATLATDPQEIARALHAEATGILDGGLRSLLEGFGRPVPQGSYALDLMVWRDLDLYLIPPHDTLDVDRFFALGGMLAQRLQPHRMHFRDETRRQSPGLPAGMYWGVYLPDTTAPGWKIDPWAITAQQCSRLVKYQAWVTERLTPESRKLILDLKTSVHRHPKYRRGFGAKEVYDAVLSSKVRTLDEFSNYLVETGGVHLNR